MVKKKRVTKKTSKKGTKKAVTKTLKKRRAGVKGTSKKTAKKATGRVAKKFIRKTSVKSSAVAEHEQAIAKATAQLGMAHAKEVTQCEKLLAKLQVKLDRATDKQKLLRDKKQAAAQKMAEKPTQATKNQARRARESLSLVNATLKEIRAEVGAARTALMTAKSAQKKFIAREKQLEKFERDWVNAAKPKRKIRRRRRQAVTEAMIPTVEEAKVEVTERAPTEPTVSEISREDN